MSSSKNRGDMMRVIDPTRPTRAPREPWGLELLWLAAGIPIVAAAGVGGYWAFAPSAEAEPKMRPGFSVHGDAISLAADAAAWSYLEIAQASDDGALAP